MSGISSSFLFLAGIFYSLDLSINSQDDRESKTGTFSWHLLVLSTADEQSTAATFNAEDDRPRLILETYFGTDVQSVSREYCDAHLLF